MTSPVCNVWCVAVHGGGSPECGGEAEGPPGLGAPQLSQILGLQLHHHIVEPAVVWFKSCMKRMCGH